MEQPQFLTETSDGVSNIAIYPTSDPVSTPISQIENVKGRAIWSADGLQLYYASDKNRINALYQRAVSNGTVAPVDNVILENLADPFSPSVVNTITGDLYFTSNYIESSLTEVTIDWSEQSFGPTDVIETSNRLLWTPAISPDGSRLAYCQGHPGQGHGSFLGVRDLRTAEYKEFGFEGLNIELPSEYSRLEWTPDGKLIVAMFNAYDGQENKTHGLAFIDPADGSVRREILNAQSLTKVLLSNNQVVYFNDRSRHLIQRDLDSKNEKVLARFGGKMVTAATLSHDRLRIALFVESSESAELAIYDLQSGNLSTIRQIASDQRIANHHAPIWSPDDSALLFGLIETGQMQFYHIALGSQSISKFGKSLNAEDNAWSFTNPSADASVLRFVREQNRSSAWGVENIKQ